jgi:ABC-type nickel/cobalt efflux system permease component RcnA
VPEQPPETPLETAAAKPSLKQLTPLDLPMVPFVLGGMAVWLLLALVCLIFRDTLAAQGREQWLTICLSGFLVAIPGLGLMIVHDVNRRRRLASRDRT